MNHDHHNHCDHDLKFCKTCDVAYCTKCTREWKHNGWNLNGPWLTTSGTYSTESTGGAAGINSVSGAIHQHN